MTKEKFKGIYRIQSSRHPYWNYSSAGPYFITICTANKEHYLGEIIDNEMKLSEIGNVVLNEWLKTTELRPDMNIVLDEFCIMPNHFHAIIGFGGKNAIKTKIPPNKFGPQSKNLGAVVRGFKSVVKKYATINNIDFAWQSHYHDRIIRNDNEFYGIKNYIYNNLKNWDNDELF